MTRCLISTAAQALLCSLLTLTIVSADNRAPPSPSAYNPASRYAYGPSPPPPSAYGAPPRGTYDPYGPAGPAQPNQRFFLEPIKGILDKINPFNKGGYPAGSYGGLPSPFGGVFPNPFVGLCNPVGGAVHTIQGGGIQGGGYKPPLPPGYNPPLAPGYSPPSSDAAYIPPSTSGNRPIIIYTRPSAKSPTYSRPSDDRPSYDSPDRKKHMLTSRPHPLYG